MPCGVVVEFGLRTTLRMGSKQQLGSAGSRDSLQPASTSIGQWLPGPGACCSRQHRTCRLAHPCPAAIAGTSKDVKSFADCCQISFNRPGEKPLGNGKSNFTCYVARNVFNPPCWVKNQDSAIKNCVQTMDKSTCQSGAQRWGGRRQRAAAAQAA